MTMISSLSILNPTPIPYSYASSGDTISPAPTVTISRPGRGWSFFAPAAGALTQTLQATPRQQTPIFVGTYHLDAQGFYERDTVYSYAGKITEQNGDPRTDLPERYFQIDRKTNVLTLNTPMEQQTLYLGLISGQPIDYFDLPIYPVDWGCGSLY
jgi:hypothetical protein